VIAPALLALALAAPAPDRLVVLCYHGVADGADRYALPVRRFTEQISWLRGEGWQPVSLQQVLDARAGRRPLPQKAVLLTFDDGYANFYTTVFPVLKRQYYPALLALVGSWLEVPEGGKADVDGQPVPRSSFLSWDQTAIEAMPLMEGEKDAEKFFRLLLQKVAAQPRGLERAVFELQARDWRTGKPVPTKTLAAWMRQLELGGGRNLAYYPDDPIQGHPALDLLVPRFSLRAWP
jgi:peptidoglycan/xylan/chitin deacetylase (PgdA/CDA1 family)